MFYVVPYNRSIISASAKFETLTEAKAEAEALKFETGENYDIIMHSRVYSTETFADAHMAAKDVPHMARD